MSKIPFNNFKSENLELLDEMSEAFRARVTQGGFILGDAIDEFEKCWSEFTGARYTVSCSTGTDALLLALKALDIGEGDEVISTAHTFFATTESIMLAGAKPVFVDVSPITGLIDADLIESKITENTKAIMPVHLYGQPCELVKLAAISEKYAIPVIEDSAQTHGVRIEGKHLGTFGTMGCFSFYPAKTLGALGDAGAVITDSEELYKKLLMYRDHGRPDKFNHLLLSAGHRMDAIQADFLRIKTRDFEKRLEGRLNALSLYFKELADINDLKLLPKEMHHYPLHLYVVRTEKRDELKKHLEENGVSCGIHYPTTSNKQPAYSDLFGNPPLPETEKFASTCLSLPLFNSIREQEVHYVCEKVRSFFR